MTTPYSTKAANLANDEVDSASESRAVVNNAIEALIDGVRGFEAAAEKAEGDVERMLTSMGSRRRETTEDLILIAADADMDPITLDDEGTLTGVLHRSWISIRDAVQGDSGVAAAALNGEEHAKKELAKALDKGLPESIATVTQRALGEIEANISNLQPLTS